MHHSHHSEAPIWEAPFEKSIRLGFADQSLEEHLDELLGWYTQLSLNSSSGAQVSTDSLSTKLYNDLGEEGFRRRFEDFLDRLIFSNEATTERLFDDSLSADKSKWRYRKLMSIFHPDKGVNSADWLNYRAEKVNELYARAQNLTKRPSVKKSSSSYSDATTRRHFDSSVAPKIRKIKRKRSSVKPFENWRDAFGDPSVLEKRLIILVLLSSALALSLLTMSFMLGG